MKKGEKGGPWGAKSDPRTEVQIGAFFYSQKQMPENMSTVFCLIPISVITN